jgi:predicted enzyme related to lactoylglutathione lyase
MIGKMSGAVIWTDDLARLAAFYKDTMGLEKSFENEEFVVLGDLGIGKHSEVHGKARDPYRIMLGFDVDDAQAEYKRLKDKGVEFIREPSLEPDGQLTIATLKDPDGNIIQLFQSA